MERVDMKGWEPQLPVAFPMERLHQNALREGQQRRRRRRRRYQAAMGGLSAMLLIGTAAVLVVDGDDRTDTQVYAGLHPAEPETGETKAPLPGNGSPGTATSTVLEEAPTPALATNGKIAFIRSAGPDDPTPKVFVMNDDGSDLTMIAETRSGRALSWSPDGTKLAFEDVSGIYLVNADGTGETRLPIEPDDHRSPSWSPDGTKLAVGSVDFGRGISVVNIDGTGRTRLTDDGREPAWSPEGKRIAYVVGHARGTYIYVMNADGSAQRRVTNLDTDRSGLPPAPAWSPDGRMIVFAYNNTISVLDVDGGQVRRLATAGDNGANNLIGSGPNPLSSRSGSPATPQWSPDGEKITFALRGSAKACSIWVMSADGTEQKELTDSAACNSAPAWQPRPL